MGDDDPDATRSRHAITIVSRMTDALGGPPSSGNDKRAIILLYNEGLHGENTPSSGCKRSKCEQGRIRETSTGRGRVASSVDS